MSGHRSIRILLPLTALLLIALVAPRSLPARVVRVVVDERTDVLGGHGWGSAGAYEKLVGRIYFEFDPYSPANQAIVDLEHAILNGEGMVEAWADFMVLQPKDPARRRGVAWVEVSNRGGKASLRYFNAATAGGTDPTSAGDFGDGLLMRQGLTIVWVGWQWDVPDREGLLRLRVSGVRGPGGAPIEGLVRSDWTVDRPRDVLPLSHRGHRTYPATDPNHPANTLTVRDGRMAPRRVVPRDQWQFLAPAEGVEAGRFTMIRIEGGFEPGKIYELVYRSRDPRLVGLGLAAVRDVLSYAKYDFRSVFPVERGIAFGVSQTGRFLRHFLYQGFNTDEEGRKVYDGMLIHTAGAGRGSFNHRFGQPSRDAHRYSAFFYPTDIFPFTSRPQDDPVSGLREGLLDLVPEEDRPFIFHTNTGYEYWGRAASLIHTTVDGASDVAPYPRERIYHLASGQHFVGRFPPPEGALMQPRTRAEGTASGVTASGEDETEVAIYRGNPLDFLVTLRALAVRLVEWVVDGRAPPPSAYPRIAEGTLVPPGAVAFPRIPGLSFPTVIHEAYRADYGPRFRSAGIVDRQPPELGPAFPSLVSQVDGLGNEVGGLRSLELRVPLATYAPWNLRWGYPEGTTHELTDFLGTFAPLPASEEERRATGDPRPSVEALYPSRDVYLRRVGVASRDLVRGGVLLEEDVGRVVERARELWELAVERREVPAGSGGR